MNQRVMRMNEIWQIRVRPVCCGCRRITQMTRHAFIIIRPGDRFQSTVVSATEIFCRLTRMEAFEVRLRPGIWKQFRNKTCSSSAAISSSSNSNSPSSVYITPLVAAISSPAVAAAPPPVVAAPPDAGLCHHCCRFSSPHHLFKIFHVRSQNFAMLAKQRWRKSIRIYSIDT